MVVDALSSELERLYDLEELKALSADLLGLDPEVVGGGTAKGSFARALTQRCVDMDAVDALLDVVEASHRALSPELVEKLKNGLAGAVEHPQPGDRLGEAEVLSELGSSRATTVYRVRVEGEQRRLRVLARDLVQRRRDVQRYLAATRLAARVVHPGLPDNVRVPAALDAAHPGISHDLVDGETLASVLRSRGGRHLNELLPLLWAIAEALGALHAEGLAHGAVHAGNVLVADPSPQSPRIVLLDAGSHHLRPGMLRLGGQTPSWLETAPPELLRGEALDPRSDVYSLGALVYQLMAGRGPYTGSAPLDVVLGHLIEEPESLGFVAPGNGATPEVDSYVRLLLDKDRDRRPRDAREALEGLRRLWRASQRPPAAITEEMLTERFQELADRPWDEQKAAELESLLDLGVEAGQLADGFFEAARQVRDGAAPGSDRAMKRLLIRAARLYESAEQHEEAERLYRGLIKLDAKDNAAVEALDRVQKKLGRFEELVESLLERTEKAETPEQRGDYFTEIGKIYRDELNDREQALVAFTQALCEDPLHDRHAPEVERLADNRAAWEEVLERCAGGFEADLPGDAKAELAFQMARWYAGKLGRGDLAVPWLLRAIELNPGHDRALGELCQLYRAAQQWHELGQTLLRRAEVAAPGLARDLKAEAAEVLVTHLGNPAAAQDLFRAVLTEDPGHESAALGIARLLRAGGQVKEAVKILEARAQAMSGEPRHALLCQIAEDHEIELNQLSEAERLFRKVLEEDDAHLDALRGLDRVLTRAGRHSDLLKVLARQLELSLTARQKVQLHERIAGIYDEEFLDHEGAAKELETVVELDPRRATAVGELARHYRSLERWSDLASLYERQLELETDKERRVELGMQLGRVSTEQLGDPGRAIRAYDAVLASAPGHAGALEALAAVRASVGDAESALRVLDELAEKADTPEARADQYLKAASLAEKRGDVNAALLRYKLAADSTPGNSVILRKVREKYLELENYAAAVDLLEEELGRTEGAHARARLAGEVALLCHRHLLDDDRARNASQLALQLDPTNPQALRVQGRLAYAEEHFTEAAKRLEGFIPQLSSLDREEAAETALIYVDALVKSGAADKAVGTIDSLIDVLSHDPNALLRISEISLEHGPPERTLAICDRLLQEHDSLLDAGEIAAVLVRRGEALLKAGRIREALDALQGAVEKDPLNAAALRALAKVHALREDWDRVVETRYRELELVSGEERAKTLTEIAEIASDKLQNPDYAARALLTALHERPNDRNVLAKLMQLYSAGKDWTRLVDVIARLAEVVNEPKQRAKYLQTAAMLSARELGDVQRALDFVDDALHADPDNQAAFNEALSLRRRIGDHDGVKDLLKRRAQQLAASDDKTALLDVLMELGDVYERNLGRPEQAIRVFESALEAAGPNPRLEERLALLYASEPGVYFDQAVASLGAWIRRDAYRPEPYKLMRRVYTEVRRADGAYAACQALHVLGQADTDEERFYARMRDGEPAQLNYWLTPEERFELVTLKQGDTLLTALFALIEPYAIAANAQSPEAFGLSPEAQLDVENYPYGFVQAIHLAAEALGIPEPAMFQRQEEPGALEVLPTRPPVLSLGVDAFSGVYHPLQVSFLAAQQVAYFQPGYYLRRALLNMTALKAWLFAAIRMVKDKFPVTPDLVAPVNEAARGLAPLSQSGQLGRLTQVVSELLASDTALDLKRWIHGVDLAVDRAGLAVCHDLETACSMIQSLPAAKAAPPIEARLENLMVYSVIPEYLDLRARQGVSLDA